MDARLEAGTGSRLLLRSVNGTVNVRAGDASAIHVHAEGDDVDIREAVDIRQDADGVSVKTNRGEEVDFEIAVPADCRVTVYTSNADVNLRGLRAPATVETANGDVTVEGMTGECRVQSANGSFSGRGLSNRLNVDSAGGDVEILGSQLTGLVLHNASGDVTVETALEPNGQYVLHSVSGDAELRLPATAKATIEVHTLTGDVTGDLPLQIVEPGPRHWKATINGGGTRIMMHSTSGDLRLRTWSAHTRENTEQEQAAPPAADQSMSILRALERGEITVEDAMEQLDEVETR